MEVELESPVERSSFSWSQVYEPARLAWREVVGRRGPNKELVESDPWAVDGQWAEAYRPCFVVRTLITVGLRYCEKWRREGESTGAGAGGMKNDVGNTIQIKKEGRVGDKQHRPRGGAMSEGV